MARAKKQNFFVSYFKNFGLKQICDISMLVGTIVLIVGLFTINIVVAVGLGFYILASAIAVIRSVKVLVSSTNKRSPEYKAALVNTVLMALVFALSVFSFIYALIS